LLGIVAALGLGGRLQNLPRIVTDLYSADTNETSSGQTLH
jgi:hypothetical protein